jgi:ubiquinone biosynthesis protein
MLAKVQRICKIIATIWQFRLFNLFIDNINKKPWIWLAKLMNKYQKPTSYTRGQSICLAFENLGPIFIKFGQMLSTRADMIPLDIAKALSRLQDQVPPFSSDLAVKIVEKSLGKPINESFLTFNPNPIASASMAQVHIATIEFKDENSQELLRKKVAVKVLRPNMKPIIENDLALMRVLARWLQKIFPDIKRLKPQEIISEFDTYLHNELDLMIESSNGSQLARNMRKHAQTEDLILVPEIYFDWCSQNVLTMEWMEGVQISKTNELEAKGVDLKKLASNGVEIFFSQVFRDGFFHADMHPGNILVNVDKEIYGEKRFANYISLDFGIMGTLSAFDKHYLAHNFLAFFERDYHRVALLHVESGWVPKNVNIEALESAIRSCCEPYFDKPLKDISLGLVLMRLFQTAKKFELNIQPQLILLQKTLLNVESLGRELNPDLDLWKTAKPILQRWVSEQIGMRSFVKTLRKEAPLWGKLLPQIPRMLHESLHENVHNTSNQDAIAKLINQQQKLDDKLNIIIAFVIGISFGFILLYLAKFL